MGFALLSHKDVERFIGELRQPEQRLIRPSDMVRVCRRALELKQACGVLEAIPKVLKEEGIVGRSRKEQDAYRHLLISLLTQWRGHPKKRKSTPPPSEKESWNLLTLLDAPKKEAATQTYRRDLFD